MNKYGRIPAIPLNALDKEKAIAFGYIHDIGRRVGRVNLRHI